MNNADANEVLGIFDLSTITECTPEMLDSWEEAGVISEQAIVLSTASIACYSIAYWLINDLTSVGIPIVYAINKAAN